MARHAPNQMSFFDAQVDLFDAGSQNRTASSPVDNTPDAGSVEYRRRRLGEIVGELEVADTMPWKPSLVTVWTRSFPELVKMLPDEEAAEWQAKFNAEIKRLTNQQ